jgi:hypothetical protein
LDTWSGIVTVLSTFCCWADAFLCCGFSLKLELECDKAAARCLLLDFFRFLMPSCIQLWWWVEIRLRNLSAGKETSTWIAWCGWWFFATLSPRGKGGEQLDFLILDGLPMNITGTNLAANLFASRSLILIELWLKLKSAFFFVLLLSHARISKWKWGSNPGSEKVTIRLHSRCEAKFFIWLFCRVSFYM